MERGMLSEAVEMKERCIGSLWGFSKALAAGWCFCVWNKCSASKTG